MFRYAIFDLDGTLLNTLLDLADCVNATLRHFDLQEVQSDDVMRALGSGRTNLIRRMSGVEDPERLEEICVYYDALYGKNYRRLTRAYDGIAEALAKLQDAGVGMAVLSNKQHPMTVSLIAECLPEIRFAAVLGQRPGVALKPEAGENVALFDVGKVRVKHLRHRGTGDICALLRQTALGKIPPRVLGICHIDVGDYIDDPAVCLLRKTLVLAAVAGFHVEDRNMQPLCRDSRQAGVRVTEDKHSVRLYLRHQLV